MGIAARVGAGCSHPKPLAAVELQVGADMWVERPHGALELGGGAGGIKATLLRFDLLRVGRLRLVLLGELEIAGLPKIESAHEDLTRQLSQPGREGPVVLMRSDLERLLKGHRAGVQAGGDPEDRDVRPRSRRGRGKARLRPGSSRP